MTPDLPRAQAVVEGCKHTHVVLDLRGQDNTTRIALEPAVINALNRYVKSLEATPPGGTDE